MLVRSDQVPANADGFLSVLGPGSSMMASFARALTVLGSESIFKMILAHGICHVGSAKALEWEVGVPEARVSAGSSAS